MEPALEEAQKDNSSILASDMLPVNTIPDIAPPPASQDTLKKLKKEEKERSKKDDKSIDQFMKSLNSIPNLDDKLSVVCKKYVQTADDNKKLQFYIKQSDKRYALMTKDKEHLQQEFNKTVLVKSKLENLCRELQKQNKAIKEESFLKLREEEERRKEIQAKFQNTLSEITNMLQQNNEKNSKLRDDNISMAEKFKSVVQQYHLREQQIEKMAKQITLENQLAAAKLQKVHLEHQAEKERVLAEVQQMVVTMEQYKAKILELQESEAGLKEQLALYTDKYDEFQNALVKSNQVFGGFKEQMEMMTKKIKRLEKESLSWKTRWETSQTAVLEMCAEKQASEEKNTATSRQLQHMQSLCRTLQAERTALLNTLKENNIERPPLPMPPPAPPTPIAPSTAVPPPANNSKVDAMVANCAQLRQSLAHLQSQLNVLTINKNEETAAKSEKQKKSKSKKSKAEKQAQKAEKDCHEKAKKLQNNEPDSTNDNAGESNSCVKEGDVDNCMNIENSENNIDDTAMESLIESMDIANIDLNDLQAVNDEIKEKVDIENVIDFTCGGTEAVPADAVAEAPIEAKVEAPIEVPAAVEPNDTPAVPEEMAQTNIDVATPN